MREKLAKDLRGLLDGTLSVEAFRQKMNDYPVEELSKYVNGCIDHFLDDADIRAKDSDYKDMQESELKKFISLLEGKGTLEEIQRIHFLGRSGV